jgi:integrase
MKSAGVPETSRLGGGIEGKSKLPFHACATRSQAWLADADVHADVRQKLTGHSSSGIHQRYTHHDEALDRAIGTLPAL